VLSDALIDNKKYINTIYIFSVDNINMYFLEHYQIQNWKDALEAINTPDILFVPIGGGGYLTLKCPLSCFVARAQNDNSDGL